MLTFYSGDWAAKLGLDDDHVQITILNPPLLERVTLFKKLDFSPEELLTLNPFVWVWMQSLSHDGLKSALDASTQSKVWEKWLFYSMLWKWSANQFSLNKSNSFQLCSSVAWRETCWMGSYWLVLLALFMDQWAHTCLVVTECMFVCLKDLFEILLDLNRLKLPTEIYSTKMHMVGNGFTRCNFILFDRVYIRFGCFLCSFSLVCLFRSSFYGCQRLELNIPYILVLSGYHIPYICPRPSILFHTVVNVMLLYTLASFGCH